MLILYDYCKTIVGQSEILYDNKWHKVLYKDKDFVIIRIKGEYMKITSNRIEDTQYNNLAVDNFGCLRLATFDEMQNLIQEGERNVTKNYDMLAIYKLAGKELHIHFGIAVCIYEKFEYVITDNSNENCEWFEQLLQSFNNVTHSDKRKQLNRIMINYIPSVLFVRFNYVLSQSNINTDTDFMNNRKIFFDNFIKYIIAELE